MRFHNIIQTLKEKNIPIESTDRIQSNQAKEIIETNPVKLFRSWFKEAIVAGEHEPEAMALATTGKNGRPGVRMVLFKDFITDGFTFFTNYESRKAIEIEHTPYGSLLFYWPKLYRQVRVEGKIRKAPAIVSDRYFGSRPLENRISACISPQSAVIPDHLFLDAMHEAFRKDLGTSEPDRPETWGGFLLIPDRFEFWTGRENRLHDRIQYRKTRKGWIIEWLAP